MSLLRRASACVLVAAALAAGGLTPGGTSTADAQRDSGSRAPAPTVVFGVNGNLFFGVDFDYYCQLGDMFEKGLDRLARLSKLIERSGRTVVFTAAPSKSTVMPQALGASPLPHGHCDRRGMAEQRRLMDDYDDERFLPLRQLLSQDQRQVYWKTDHHWTTVGASVFTKALAERLSPELARRQHYRPTTMTALGLLNEALGRWVEETAESAVPAGRVEVRTAKGSEDWNGMPYLVLDHSWVSRPARLTWPGNTLFLGDSFGMYALENLRPMFRKGRFMWNGYSESSDVVAAIKKADTVIIEVYQTGVGPSILGEHSLLKEVHDALRQDLRPVRNAG